MMAMTTRSSMSVKARIRFSDILVRVGFREEYACGREQLSNLVEKKISRELKNFGNKVRLSYKRKGTLAGAFVKFNRAELRIQKLRLAHTQIGVRNLLFQRGPRHLLYTAV